MREAQHERVRHPRLVPVRGLRVFDRVRGVAAHVRAAREEERREEQFRLRRLAHQRGRRHDGRPVYQVRTIGYLMHARQLFFLGK